MAIAVAVIAGLGGAYILLAGATQLGDDGEQTADEAAQLGIGQVRVLDVNRHVNAEGHTILYELVQSTFVDKPADLERLGLWLGAQPHKVYLVYGEEAGAETFSAKAIRDDDASFPILNEGDVAEITINLHAAGLEAQRSVLSQTQVDPQGIAVQQTIDLDLVP